VAGADNHSSVLHQGGRGYLGLCSYIVVFIEDLRLGLRVLPYAQDILDHTVAVFGAEH
jgi:hypothetical protein